MFESLGVINVWTYLVGLFFIIIAPGPNSFMCCEPLPCAA
jgi:leucine efflux protein